MNSTVCLLNPKSVIAQAHKVPVRDDHMVHQLHADVRKRPLDL
ncbi:MAG: hypothetical protein ACLR4W_10970 [Oscillospiraceae bacterium]